MRPSESDTPISDSSAHYIIYLLYNILFYTLLFFFF